jgi:predicted nucleic acid-binding protein
MNEVVLDASVVLKWFRADGESRVTEARQLREQFEAGQLGVLAPPLLWLEVLNVVGRSWRWTAPQLEDLATLVADLGFELVEAELPFVAYWTERGLTAYDAAYVGVAAQTGAQLVTDDAGIVRIAPELTVAL